MSGVKAIKYISLNGRAPHTVEGAIIEETHVCISVNGVEWVAFMASPRHLDKLALGFLANEGVIGSLADVRHVHLARNGRCADVWLRDTTVEKPARFTITAGCGGGVTFNDLSQRHEPLYSDLTATPQQLAALMRQTLLGAEMYREARGVHTAVLAEGNRILLQMEDIGRHNCLDKLRGAALLDGVPTENRILLSSGRISSEMINKARRIGTPIVCSRTSPTSLSVALAEAWHMSIVAYLRQDRMRIYTHPERILEG